jgi:hypothetical protein
VHEVQVDAVESEPVEALADRGTRLVAVVAVVPQLRGDEQLSRGDAAAGDGRADARFVAVDRRGVDVAVADLEAFADRALRVRRRNLEHAVAELGDVVAVVELNRGDFVMLQP